MMGVWSPAQPAVVRQSVERVSAPQDGLGVLWSVWPSAVQNPGHQAGQSQWLASQKGEKVGVG